MPKPRPVYERLMAKVVELPDGCKKWTGTITGSRRVYGVIRGEDGKPKQVHRVAWEHEVGPIPEGMTLDHLCALHVCVNVMHLQLATRAENTRLRWERNPAPDVCPKGHSNWAFNTVQSGNEKGRVVRRCRSCRAEYDRGRA